MIGHLRSKLANFGWLGVEQVVRLLLALAVMVLVARYLGPDRFGAYSFVFGIAALLAPVARLGMDGVFLSRAASHPASARNVLARSVRLSASAAVLLALASVAYVYFVPGPPGATVALMLLASLTILIAPADFFLLWLKASEQVNVVVIVRVAVMLAAAAAAAILILREATLASFVAIRGVEAVLLGLSAVAVALALRSHGPSDAGDAPSTSDLLRDSFPLLLSAFASAAFMRLDQVMLGTMAAPAELGTYSVAVRVSETVNFLPVVLQGTLFATMSRNFHRSAKDFDAYMQRIYDVSGLLAWSVMVGMAAVSYFALAWVFGDAYSGAIPMTLILLTGTPFFFLYYAWGSMLMVRRWYWSVPLVTGLGALANFLLNMMLIPLWGGEGAAVATVGALFVSSIGGSLLIAHLRPAARGMIRALDPIGSVLRTLPIVMNRGNS